MFKQNKTNKVINPLYYKFSGLIVNRSCHYNMYTEDGYARSCNRCWDTDITQYSSLGIRICLKKLK